MSEQTPSPPPMPEHQLRYFTEQTARAVKRGVQAGIRSARNQFLIGYVILLVGLIGAFMVSTHDNSARRHEIAKASADQVAAVRSASVIQIKATRAASVANCNGQFRATESLKTIIRRSMKGNTAVYKSGGISREQHQQALKTYRELQKKLVLPDCRKIRDLISTDPARPVPVVIPRYPGDGGG